MGNARPNFVLLMRFELATGDDFVHFMSFLSMLSPMIRGRSNDGNKDHRGRGWTFRL